MMRVGGTGHRLLHAETARMVERALHERLARLPADVLVGVSSLADGADQLFAEAILALGGSLEVVLPASRYREALPAECLAAYDRLLASATIVQCLAYEDSTSEAHMEAGRMVVDRSDVLVAVWDGHPARGVGGTGDVVAYARKRGVPVEVVWPRGAAR
jgi:hypothetical protein